MKNGIKVEDNALIGMGSIVMDDYCVESRSIIIAGAVLLEINRVETGSILGWNSSEESKVYFSRIV